MRGRWQPRKGLPFSSAATDQSLMSAKTAHLSSTLPPPPSFTGPVVLPGQTPKPYHMISDVQYANDKDKLLAAIQRDLFPHSSSQSPYAPVLYTELIRSCDKDELLATINRDLFLHSSSQSPSAPVLHTKLIRSCDRDELLATIKRDPFLHSSSQSPSAPVLHTELSKSCKSDHVVDIPTHSYGSPETRQENGCVFSPDCLSILTALFLIVVFGFGLGLAFK
ncbi:hypothetical protein MPTK1_3g17730 [Marchantia polymorpha subsp. ruderalis]|uniref:Uncharacterized protein n=2 Tax=Marchantia polymorpha TaxID=3197 RepID=A0AAF6B1Y4_MARPO|nr:hypothetical protein MARPO_0039s0023 [Marchantia polymorpha]BBN06018.1 hypothetical protein Mp_3g17730 [Marchantia polymorpha subsp. ruderalis]|eukprot:PTQ40510.1 hypothetical protein MARPO_0039s0023 [Marchantia polymorpha]